MGRGGREAGCVDGGAGHGRLEKLENGFRSLLVGELEALGSANGVERGGWRKSLARRRNDEHEIFSIDFLFSIIHQTSD